MHNEVTSILTLIDSWNNFSIVLNFPWNSNGLLNISLKICPISVGSELGKKRGKSFAATNKSKMMLIWQLWKNSICVVVSYFFMEFHDGKFQNLQASRSWHLLQKHQKLKFGEIQYANYLLCNFVNISTYSTYCRFIFHGSESFCWAFKIK